MIQPAQPYLRRLVALVLLVLLSFSIGCEDTEKPEIDPIADNPGKYVELTDENFEEVVLGSDKLVMVDFWNRQCQPCIEMAPWVAEISKEYDGRVVVGKLNTLKEKKYGVHYRAMTVPQILFFKDGEVITFDREGAEVDRLGYASKGEMTEVLDELLARPGTANQDGDDNDSPAGGPLP